ncbi:NACHT domain-containing protein [Streptomyces sp. NPDC002144]
MPGGRPSRSGHDGYPELAELATWFKEAITNCGYSSVNAFVQQNTLDKNKVYEVARGTVLLSLDSMKGLARLLKRDPAEVEPLWMRAREAMDLRVMADDKDGKPRVVNWAEIPRPELALRNVLDALAYVTEQLPYRLLGINPPSLSTVYVRQRLRESSHLVSGEALPKERDRSEDRTDRNVQGSADIPVTISEALNRSEHLFITGEPGAGKSTLGHQLISRLAKIWLRQESATNPPLAEPVVPLRVAARFLVGDGAWSTVLSDATRRALGPYLVTEPTQQLFAGRTHGVRWLIVVDGLDEILDRPTRASIIRALGQHARVNGEYRFVITSRPLPDEELAPLYAANISVCRIEPFEPEELKLFAERWFLSQDPITAEQKATQFLEQVSDGRLKDLVRNPLLASIAAVVNTLEPGRPLPANRIDLYQRFYEYLVTDEEASGRATPKELRRLEETHPARYRVAEWIHSQRTSIIDAMAKERLTTDTPLTEVACNWVRTNKPPDLVLPPGWEADADRLLIDTGMLVYESSGLRFLHHTFAEFLAARTYARSIPSDFPEKKEWFKRGLREAEQNFVILTFALWGKSPGNDVGIILRSLLDGGYGQIRLAGRLLAELGDSDDLSARLVVDRLTELALGNALDGGEDHDFVDNPRRIRLANMLSKSDQVFDVIALLSGNEHASRNLRNIAGRRELSFQIRVLAVAALEKVESKKEALELLRSLSLESSHPLNRMVYAFGFLELDPSKTYAEVRDDLVAVKDHPQANHDIRMNIAETAVDKGGDKELATEICWSVLSASDADFEDIRSAIKLLLSQSSDEVDTYLEAIIEQILKLEPLARAESAREILNAGHIAHAKIIAHSVLNDMGAPGHVLTQVAEILLQDAPNDVVEELIRVLRERPDWSSERADLLDALLDAGWTEFVITEAIAIIEASDSRPYAVGAAASAWLAAVKPEGATELMGMLRSRPYLDPWTRANTSRALADAGYIVEAADIAYPIFLDPQSDSYDLRSAAHVALQEGAPSVDDIIISLKERSVGGAKESGRMIQVCALLEKPDEITIPALQLIGTPGIERKIFESALDALISTIGTSIAERIVESLASQTNPAYRFTGADRLANAGALKAAVTIWRDLITVDTLSTADSYTVLTRLINTGHREEAIGTLKIALENSLGQYNRGRIRRLLAWAVLADPSDTASFMLDDVV